MTEREKYTSAAATSNAITVTIARVSRFQVGGDGEIDLDAVFPGDFDPNVGAGLAPARVRANTRAGCTGGDCTSATGVLGHNHKRVAPTVPGGVATARVAAGACNCGWRARWGEGEGGGRREQRLHL